LWGKIYDRLNLILLPKLFGVIEYPFVTVKAQATNLKSVKNNTEGHFVFGDANARLKILYPVCQ